MAPSVIVVGAGMAGLTASRLLAASGMHVTVLDKGRAVGGRMATRRVGDATFDHGAQHISVRTDSFARLMRRLEDMGTARVWIRTESATSPERGIENRYGGVGGMRRIPEVLAAGLSVTTGVAIDRLAFDGGSVTAHVGARPVAAAADAVLLTAPLPQSLQLLEASGVERSTTLRRLARIDYDATLAVMAALDEPAGLADGHLALDTGPVAWLADNQHKGVSAVPALTIHSSADFAEAHFAGDPAEWAAELLAAARPHHRGEVIATQSHRWRYSQPRATCNEGAIVVHGPAPVVLAGEVFAGARVEGAYTSGRAAASLLREHLPPAP